ncbi:TIGR02452 family protein [Actinoplanes sp. N902-109]|uniref:TIGR02452 family protein n=1 Tax=Actinoplanes sp. (strain N902-109) TaxID=649831 RepID=UPI0005A003C7|nr:TIGR02452 family protein [Actinoplanes sp. N902-109]
MSARLRDMARTAVEIAERQAYRTARGTDVRIDVSSAVAGTRLYEPDQDLPADDLRVGRRPRGAAPVIEVTGESTLAAARRLGGDVAALVFASARNPGGGFRNGAQAQEESIARSSALYPCLLAAGDFYAGHRSHSDLAYSDRVIYSPRVPVFRDDHGELLDDPYEVSFLTAAAPNRGALPAEEVPRVPEILRRRARRVLAVAAAHGHRRLVLGAWGCGVFRNDPTEVARAFADALRTTPVERVVFAVLGPNRPEFTAVLADSASADSAR